MQVSKHGLSRLRCNHDPSDTVYPCIDDVAMPSLANLHHAKALLVIVGISLWRLFSTFQV